MFGKWSKESARKHLCRVKRMPELRSILIEEEGKSSKTFKELIDLHLEKAFGLDGAPNKDNDCIRKKTAHRMV